MAFDPISIALDVGGKVIDRLWPDPSKAQEAKLELLKMAQTGELARLNADTELAKAQLQVNAAEAASPSAFASGWRPMVGYVCATGLAVQFLVRPIALWGCSLAHAQASFPELDLGTLLTLLFGMLGLGAMRTTEKLNGVAR